MKYHPLFLLFGGSFLIGLMFAWAFYAPPTLAAKQLNPVMQTKADNQICPLSDSQQERAQQAFAEMDRMLKSSPPRCINCHGGIQPFREGTKHPGGRLSWIHDKKGRRDLLATRQGQCVLCHNPPWQAPAGDDFWVDKNAIQLCRHFRQQFDIALKFFHHVEADPLADIAFAGTRGLNDNGQLFAEMQPYTPEKPNFVRADLRSVSGAWVDAMGGEFKGGESCGCEPHHYLLKLSTDITFTYVKQDLRGEGQGHADLSIPLTFKDDGSFSGQATTKRPYRGTTIATIGTCKVTYDDFQETWKVEGMVGNAGIEGKMTLERAKNVGTAVCSFSPQAVTSGIDSADGAHEFQLDAFVGQSETLEFKGFLYPAEGGDSWKIDATIVDEGK